MVKYYVIVAVPYRLYYIYIYIYTFLCTMYIVSNSASPRTYIPFCTPRLYRIGTQFLIASIIVTEFKHFYFNRQNA